jgi:hypothetical protein
VAPAQWCAAPNNDKVLTDPWGLYQYKKEAIMAHGKSFIPAAYAAYDTFFKNVCDYTTQQISIGRWTHILPAEAAALTAAYADWSAAYTVTLSPHTPAETAAAKLAHTRSKKVLSRFIQVWFRGFTDIVTTADLHNMNIPEVDTTRTPIGKPKTRPVFYIRVKDTRLLELPFQDQDSESRARPYGMNGAVISYAVLDHVPADVSELIRTELATRTPHRLNFTEEERGKTVYVALQWQNESGERGDPTEIQSTIVP